MGCSLSSEKHMSAESELHAAITTSGQVVKDIHRLQLERFTEVLDAFRSTMLVMYDELLTRVVALEEWRASQERAAGDSGDGTQ